MASRKKQDVITFKVDDSLMGALQGIQNRSEFIRSAILSALDSVCPVCKGTGVLTDCQRRHWLSFARDHATESCGECNTVHLVCVSSGGSAR